MTIPPLHDMFKVASWLALPVEMATVGRFGVRSMLRL